MSNEPRQDEERADGSLEQVRDLLFGRQMRDSEQRFVRIEERLAQEVSALRSDTRQRLEALEQFARRELDGLAKRLTDERAERGEELEALTRELREAASSLSRRLEEVREESAEAARNLHEEVLALSKSLSDDFAQRTAEHAAAADAGLRDVRHRMVDRASLSSLFAELALQLGDRELGDQEFVDRASKGEGPR